jgi:hypothetical protein
VPIPDTAGFLDEPGNRKGRFYADPIPPYRGAVGGEPGSGAGLESSDPVDGTPTIVPQLEISDVALTSSGAEESEPADLSGAGDAGLAEAGAAAGGAVGAVGAVDCAHPSPVQSNAATAVKTKNLARMDLSPLPAWLRECGGDFTEVARSPQFRAPAWLASTPIMTVLRIEIDKSGQGIQIFDGGTIGCCWKTAVRPSSLDKLGMRKLGMRRIS